MLLIFLLKLCGVVLESISWCKKKHFASKTQGSVGVRLVSLVGRSSIDGSDKGGSDWPLARFVYRGSELSAPTPVERSEEHSNNEDNAEPPMKAQIKPSHILLTITWHNLYLVR